MNKIKIKIKRSIQTPFLFSSKIYFLSIYFDMKLSFHFEIFIILFYVLQKEIQLKEYMNGKESLVAKLKGDLALSTEQEKILYKLVDTVLTDTYLTLLYALDGTASLGNGRQENFKLYGEDGELVFDSGELEMATYEAFYVNKK